MAKALIIYVEAVERFKLVLMENVLVKAFFIKASITLHYGHFNFRMNPARILQASDDQTIISSI